MHLQGAAPTDRQYINVSDSDHQKYRKQLNLFQERVKQEQNQFSHGQENTYFIVSTSFLNVWRDFCLSNQKKRPQLPVINEQLLDKKSKKMKEGLKEKEHFQFLSAKTYAIFQRYRKFQLKRKSVMVGHEKRIPVYLNSYEYLGIKNFDLKQIDLKKKKRQDFALKCIEQSQNACVQQLLRNIGERQQLPQKQFETRIWRVDKKQNLDSLFKYLKVAADRANYEYRIKGFGKLLRNQTKVEDLQMQEGDFFVVQIKQMGRKWFLQSENEKKCEGCYDVTELKYPCKCQKVAYCKVQCQEKDKRFHIKNCDFAQLQELNKPILMVRTKNSINGLAGLRNLGNTCFMNSCMQCLSNTMPLTNYFIDQLYEKEINRTNLLGTKGKLAKTYAKFIKGMWCDSDDVFNPDEIKSAVSSINPMFSGYAQHDSQEFFSFIIDGLHEDLNRVEKKPYVESVQSNNRPDKIVAIQSWLSHIKRNQSIVTDLMTGQYKSKVTCPTCSIQSITFDPFITVTLPIPQNVISIFQGFLFYHNFQTKTKRLYFKYSKPNVNEWLKQISTIAEVEEKSLMIYVVSINEGIYLAGRQSLSEMIYKVENESKNIFVIQLSEEEMNMKNRIQMVIRFSKNSGYYQTSNYENMWFKFPLFFDKENTNGKTIYKRILKFLFQECFKDSRHKSYFGGKSYEDYEQKMLKSKPFKIILRHERRLQRYYTRLQYKYESQVEILPETTLLLLFAKIDEKECELDIRFDKSGSEDFNFERLKQFDDANKKIKISKQSDEPVDLSKCFQTMNQSEQLQAGNEWYCPKCKEHKLANKIMSIYKAPKILIIHLKRFKQKGIIKKQKNETKVQFPMVLNMNDYLIDREPFDNYVKEAKEKQIYIQPKYEKEFTIKSSKQPIYDLYAVSNHSGGLGGGHYTAYAKNNEKWYDFNDSSVNSASSSSIISNRAYMLFYKRRE